MAYVCVKERVPPPCNLTGPESEKMLWTAPPPTTDAEVLGTEGSVGAVSVQAYAARDAAQTATIIRRCATFMM
jgi:hypothetical protein